LLPGDLLDLWANAGVTEITPDTPLTNTTYYIYARSAVSATNNAGTGDNITRSDPINFYLVTYETDGGVPVPTSELRHSGERATAPANPAKADYQFAGWYDNAAYTGSAWNFTSNTVTSNVTLYAKWLSGQVFGITVEAITDVSATVNGVAVPNSGTINSSTVLVRSGAKNGTISITPPAGYSVEYRYDGEVIGTGTTLAISVSNDPAEAAYLNPYNIVGSHYITVVLTSGGVPYSFRVTFEVAE
jgi:uncharacterized repeat protein (TIGR02543 family)